MFRKETIWERVLRFLFPQHWLEPAPEELGWAPGELSLDSFVYLDALDRLRLLVSGKLAVRIRSQTDVVVNKMRSRSTISVLHPWANRP